MHAEPLATTSGWSATTRAPSFNPKKDDRVLSSQSYALQITMTQRTLRLLALDGGGIRGVSSLLILQRLMEAIDSGSPPKPCDIFDMIGGTSTGG
ncbi:patatin-like phospholipase domain-containing protein [Sarocladium implicatum]|nr:patatin-like phospholipase domain-containing protein [Sarocladium implicatum]